MKSADGSFRYAYNAEAIVDAEHQVIIATTLTNIAVDVEQVVPMVKKLHATIGTLPAEVLRDAGYCSAANLDYAETVEAVTGGRSEFFIATGRVKHGERVPEAPRVRIPANATLRERMARKLKTKKGRTVYARRKAIVKPVFGQIHTRQGKFRATARVGTSSPRVGSHGRLPQPDEAAHHANQSPPGRANRADSPTSDLKIGAERPDAQPCPGRTWSGCDVG